MHLEIYLASIPPQTVLLAEVPASGQHWIPSLRTSLQPLPLVCSSSFLYHSPLWIHSPYWITPSLNSDPRIPACSQQMLVYSASQQNSSLCLPVVTMARPLFFNPHHWDICNQGHRLGEGQQKILCLCLTLLCQQHLIQLPAVSLKCFFMERPGPHTPGFFQPYLWPLYSWSDLTSLCSWRLAFWPFSLSVCTLSLTPFYPPLWTPKRLWWLPLNVSCIPTLVSPLSSQSANPIAYLTTLLGCMTHISNVMCRKQPLFSIKTCDP